MDTARYFEIISATENVLHFEMRDFWSDEVVGQIGDVFLSQFRKAAAKAASQRKFIVLADFSDLAVLSRNARVVLSQAMAYAKENGLIKGVEVVPSAITALSIREAAELTGRDDFRIVVETLEEAKGIVDDLKQELAKAELPVE
jgi:hypothetical protein